MGAILIFGPEERFFKATLKFKKYLAREVRIDPQDIRLVEAGILDSQALCTRLKNEMSFQRGKGPLLLAFVGHGSELKDAWSLGEDRFFPYELLVREILMGYPDPLLLVNDCCFAAAPIPWFEKYGISSDKVSLLAPCGASERAYGSIFFSYLLDYWRCHEAYNCKRIARTAAREPFEEVEVMNQVRWGAELDEHFYPMEFEGFSPPCSSFLWRIDSTLILETESFIDSISGQYP